MSREFGANYLGRVKVIENQKSDRPICTRNSIEMQILLKCLKPIVSLGRFGLHQDSMSIKNVNLKIS